MVVGFAALLSCAALVAPGCGAYRTPGARADFQAMGITAAEVDAQTDVSIARRLERKPLAGFPAQIAIARVQGPGYRSETVQGYGEGNFTVVTTRDVEPQDAFQRLAALPMIGGVATLNRLVLPPRLQSEEDLRKAAATVQADMLLLYTFDTAFQTDTKVRPLGLITLGLFPDRVSRVTCTASAALLDTRNGYVYGLAEGTAQKQQLSNAWNDEDALDQARRQAEREAFEKLFGGFETAWHEVVARYGPPDSGSRPAAAAAR